MLERKDLEKLADLSRIELASDEEDKLLRDLEQILKYFEELKGVDAENVAPLSGGTKLANVFRVPDETPPVSGDAARRAFPEEEKGFLKVPPVFE